MTTIQKALTDSVANIGIGESLLIFTSDSEFLKFDATANGHITMKADNGKTFITMSRDLISEAIADFDLPSRIDTLPLKTVLLTAAGNFQLDTEEPQVLGSDLEGIASRFDVPLLEKIKQVLVLQIPTYRGTSASSLSSGEDSISMELANGFKFEIKHNHDESRIRLQAHVENMPSAQALDYVAMQIELEDFNLVKVQALTGGIFTNDECILLFEVVIPAIPFIGQHFIDAITNVFAQIEDWEKFQKEDSL